LAIVSFVISVSSSFVLSVAYFATFALRRITSALLGSAAIADGIFSFSGATTFLGISVGYNFRKLWGC